MTFSLVPPKIKGEGVVYFLRVKPQPKNFFRLKVPVIFSSMTFSN